MSGLKIRLLGPPQVELDGSAVTLRRRKTIALLAYLAMDGQRQSRDALAELLYPQRDRSHAYNDFRQCLFLLRASIGDQWLRAERDGLALAGEPWVDVRVLRGLMHEARKAQRAGDSAQVLNRLSSATDLFRGDFLSGFYLRDSPRFEAWQQAEEEKLRRERSLAHQGLVRLYEERGEVESALASCRAWLSLDPREETNHRTLMRLLALDGQRSAALKQYERCREILKTELDVAPSRETEELRAQIASARIPPAAKRIAAATPAPAVRAPAVLVATDPVGVPCGTYPSVEEAVNAILGGGVLSGVRVAVHLADCAEQARRLLEIANPGQVLLSEPVAELLSNTAVESAPPRSLGLHRLRDLGPSVEVFQLHHPRSPVPAPDLRSLDHWPNNLPTQATSFVGRARELATVVDVLGGKDRLVTLTGPGGSGKTRLALQAAASVIDKFAHGVFFVDLAPVARSTRLHTAILTALKVATGERQPPEALRGYLRSRQVLLVLDNFEHLLPAAAALGALLEECGSLKALVTSRAPLGLRGERELPVPPFDVAGLTGNRPIAELKDHDAVRLFVNRARSVLPGFELTEETAPSVARICARTDGLPLAIEISAAQIKYVSSGALAAMPATRLNRRRRRDVDVPPRHRSLEAAVSWSYELLGAEERKVFRRLSVFSGGWTVAAARAVGSSGADATDLEDQLFSLVDKNLVRRSDTAGEPRFEMLETIRVFAAERLHRTREVSVAQAAHASCFLVLAEGAEPELSGPHEEHWRIRLAGESENIRSSLEWYREHDLGQGLRMAAALGAFWRREHDKHDGLEWLTWFRNTIKGKGPHTLLAAISLSMGWILAPDIATEGRPQPLECWTESLRHARASRSKRLIAQALVMAAHGYAAEPARAAAAQAEAVRLARESGDPWTIAHCLSLANYTGFYSGEVLATRRARMEEALAIAQEVGCASLIMEVTHEMAVMYGYAGELEQCMPWLLKAAEIAETRRIRGADLHNVYAHLGLVLTFLGQLERAEPYASRSLSISMQVGTHATAQSLAGLSRIARAKGDQRRAVRLRAAATAMLKPGLPNPDPAELRKLLPLDSGLFEREWRIGYAMTLDQAVAYAMEGAGSVALIEAAAPTSGARAEPGGIQLSARELEVIAHVARGKTNREISRDLYVSEHTVASHIRSILAKIGAASRTEAAAFAVRRGLAGTDPGPTRRRSHADAMAGPSRDGIS